MNTSFSVKLWNLPFEEFTDTPESPKPKQIEKTEDLSFVHFASQDSVYDVEWQSGGYVHREQ
jgi:hypothetical protein